MIGESPLTAVCSTNKNRLRSLLVLIAVVIQGVVSANYEFCVFESHRFRLIERPNEEVDRDANGEMRKGTERADVGRVEEKCEQEREKNG